MNVSFALLSPLGSSVRAASGDFGIPSHGKKIGMDLIDFCKGGIWGALGATFNKLAFQPESKWFDGWIPRLMCLLSGLFCSARMISCFASLLQQCTATQVSSRRVKYSLFLPLGHASSVRVQCGCHWHSWSSHIQRPNHYPVDHWLRVPNDGPVSDLKQETAKFIRGVGGWTEGSIGGLLSRPQMPG
eukprot:Protomagalhaensia_sp_Gyna_25__4944@NODE_533_length_3189_cov_185_222222_g417_i0_p2_GENE_NODE_533_length_3189_cov_185_222222_g417_i0NODE_533_length_3189_cov_185_222222_g417_i0_p2_ORF_typecomplete_len187_score11_98DUF1449/PF07290_11/0_15_NODE_533_length_3189_cov_185_222222_g417_i0301861